jgi:hypothetical protein
MERVKAQQASAGDLFLDKSEPSSSIPAAAHFMSMVWRREEIRAVALSPLFLV